MRFEKVINGILKYMDAEIYGTMNAWQEMAARIAVSRLLRNSDNIKKALANNTFIKTFAIIDNDGNVDVEGLMQDIKAEIGRKEKFTISIPMFGSFSFNVDDVDKLAWSIFEKTGNIGYYLFYKKIEKQQEKDIKK